MLKRSTRNVHVRAAGFVTLLLLTTSARATFTIVAVDPATGAVGFAGATCGIGIEFVPAVVPGRGVVAAQADTSFIGRDAARDWIARGAAARAVLERLADPNLYRQRFYQRWFASQAPQLQYGVATLAGDGDAAGAYSGADSAALVVADRDDPSDAPHIAIVAPRHFSFVEGLWLSMVGYEPNPGDPEPIAAVRAQFDAKRMGACSKSDA